MVITINSPWRQIGTLSHEAWRGEFHSKNSPLLAELSAVIASAGPHGALALAMSWVETQYGTVGRTASLEVKNALNLRPGPGFMVPVLHTPDKGDFLKFAQWATGFAEWRRRLFDEADTYKNGVYAKAGPTLLDLIADAYAPSGPPGTPEAQNNPEAYARSLARELTRMNAPILEETVAFTTPVPGLPTTITTSFPVKIDLIPARQTNQRPGHGFTGGRPDYYTQHETGNTNTGANAQMHRNWLHNGADGQQLSFHVVVDDKQAIVLLPFNEVAWHAGDSAGPGNFDSIACELCVNKDGNKTKARANAAELAAQIMQSLLLPIDKLVQHNRWSGKNCPEQLRQENAWPAYVTAVKSHMEPIPPPPTADWFQTFPGMDLDVAKSLFGYVQIGDIQAPFDPSGSGVLSRSWYENGAATGFWPQYGGPDMWTGILRRFDDGNDNIREYVRAGGGFTLWRPNQREPFVPLKR